jgi:hypothetical protein
MRLSRTLFVAVAVGVFLGDGGATIAVHANAPVPALALGRVMPATVLAGGGVPAS